MDAPSSPESPKLEFAIPNFPCPSCTKVFTRTSSLHRHQLQFHAAAAGEEFACSLCERRFPRRDGLVRHQRVVHEGLRQHACQFCHHAFGTRYNRLRHERACSAQEEEEEEEEDLGAELPSPASTPSPSPPPAPSLLYSSMPRTPEEESLLRECVSGEDPGRVVCRRFDIPLTVRSLKRLSDGVWLNDEIINATLAMYVDARPMWAFSTYFYAKLTQPTYEYVQVQRWTKAVNLFACRGALFPIHTGGVHWTLAAADMHTRTLHYLDSLGGDGTPILRRLLGYLQQEHQARRHGLVLPESSWTLRSWGRAELPQQAGDVDCGVFVCAYARLLVDAWSREVEPEFNFSQEEIPRIREQLKLDLVTL